MGCVEGEVCAGIFMDELKKCIVSVLHNYASFIYYLICFF